MLANGEFLERETAYQTRTAAIRAARRAMTPQQQAAETVKQARINAAVNLNRARATALQKTTVPGYTVAGPVLSPIDKEFQRMTLARDWQALFAFLPPKQWGQRGMLGKYSFIDQGDRRIFKPFSQDDIRRFVFSPYYTVQPGYTCTDEQREMGVAALWQATQRHKAKFALTDWRSIWPIYPGWGYPGQRYGCEKYVPSTWVKIRKPVIAAAAIVAAVYLGPVVLDKIAAATSGGGAAAGGASAAAGGSGAAATGGIVGAGKAGALTAAAAKAGAAATAAQSASFFQTVQSGSANLLSYVNNARTIEAISKGEIPPPPISIQGDNFTDWAMTVAKQQIAEEAQQRGLDYLQRQMTKREEDKLRAEIKAMQAELSGVIPNNVIASPDRRVPAAVQAKSAELALREKQAQDSLTVALAIAVPVGLVLMA